MKEIQENIIEVKLEAPVTDSLHQPNSKPIWLFKPILAESYVIRNQKHPERIWKSLETLELGF